MSFLGAMTLAGGLLLLIDGKPTPRTDGLSLSPLAAATTVNSISSDPLTQTRVPLNHPKWQAIVIHHSGSTRGDPTSIEKENAAGTTGGGLGHHFIIGNGNGMDDGQLYIGYRWLDQLSGTHASGRYARFYNDSAISICLVGDGDRHGFTQAQIQQLTMLVESLCKQLNLGPDRVLLHSDIAEVSDPGRLFPTGLQGLPSGRGRR
ncbi:MAG TPA: peptidoglycan recognition family protein [Phycisphaerales bacterium]|nr:peptidoglycan recognition family protein [Phycisphaerales bacterium]